MCILEDRQHVLSSTFKTLQLNLWDMSFSLSSVLHLNYRLWKQVLKKYVLKIILCIGSGSQPTCASLIFTFMPKVTSERYTLLALIVQFILDLLIASTLARKSLQAIQCSLCSDMTNFHPCNVILSILNGSALVLIVFCEHCKCMK